MEVEINNDAQQEAMFS
jgi:hypothetical protein